MIRGSLLADRRTSLAVHARELVKFMSIRQRLTWDGRTSLLQPELDRHGEVHGNCLAIQCGRLILPLAQRVHGRLM
jgi:hypothetical protein